MNEVAAGALLASPLARRLELIGLRNNRDVAKKAAELRRLFGTILLLDESQMRSERADDERDARSFVEPGEPDGPALRRKAHLPRFGHTFRTG